MSARRNNVHARGDHEGAGERAEDRTRTGDEPAGEDPPRPGLTDEELAWIAGGSAEPSEEEPFNPGHYPLST